MSGKKTKGGATGWFTCSKCDRRLPRSLSGKHADSDCGIVNPFIYHKDLYATLNKATTASKIQNLPFVKCSRLSSSTIFLPDELIRESGFRTFSWVALTSIDNCEVSADKQDNIPPPPPIALRVWPTPETIPGSNIPTTGTSSINNNCVMLTNEGFLANKLSISSGEMGLNVKLESFIDPLRIEDVTEALFPVSTSVVLELENCDTIDKSTFDPERFSQGFKNWFRNRLITIGNRFQIRFYAEVIAFKVKELHTVKQNDDNVGQTKSSTVEEAFSKLSLYEKYQFVEITDETQVQLIFNSDLTSKEITNDLLITLKDVGGLTSVLKEICSTIKFIFDSNINVAKGLILYGVSGTGKSFLVQAICNHFNLYKVTYDEFRQMETNRKRIKKIATSSNSLATVFQQAISKAPAAIIIENLDAISPKKSTTSNSSNEQISNFAVNLQSLIPSLLSKSKLCKVIILATATDVDAVDSSLRSPQIFGKEIELPVPSSKEREDILNKILNNIKNSLIPEEVKEIAGATHGFVGADLQGLCTQAAQSALERYIEFSKSDEMRDVLLAEKTCSVIMSDMTQCLRNIKPSAIKSILVDVPNVRWDDIGGQNELKFKLKQAIEWPLKHPEAFQRLGITPPKGILMYGPPGCSKTMIAKAIATESGLNFISVKGSELFSKWVGESEKAVRDVFKKARQVSPCVVFFDEIDSLGGERGSTSGSSNVHERVLAQLLVEVDGIEPLKDVTIVAATNRPDIIDQALLRPGRLDRIIYVPLPDAETRREILKIQFKKMPTDPSVNLEKIVDATEGYSGAELTALSHEAAMKALEENIDSKCVNEGHFTAALEIVKPRISKQQISFYENYSQSHKRL